MAQVFSKRPSVSSGLITFCILIFRYIILFFVFAFSLNAGVFDILSNNISINIRVTDANGKSIPYVTIWGFTNPCDGESAEKPEKNKPWYQLDLGSLSRITNRYKESYELVHWFARPLDRGIGIIIMTDADGHVRNEIDFKDLAIKVRPDTTLIGYALIRRGYLTKVVQIQANSKQCHFDLNVVLEPDSTAPPMPDREYQTTFDRIRYELSDSRKNEHMSGNNGKRLAKIRSDLELAALQSIEAGDRSTAAKIYARMETLPTLTYANGKIVGFKQTDLEAPENRAAIFKAIELDPNNDYLAMRAVREKGRQVIESISRPIMTKEDRERMLSYTKIEEDAIASHGDHAWMFDRVGLFYCYVRLELWNKAYQELQRLRQFEPHGDNYDDMLSDLKFDMKRAGVAAPKEWQ